MEACIIFGTLNAAKTIAEYLGLIETVDNSIKQLLHQQFVAAQNFLKNAETATDNIRVEYLKSALNSFNLAIAVEENENLISSYVGMAMCQYLLGDIANARSSLLNASKVQLRNTEVWRCRARNIGRFYLTRSIPIMNIVKTVQDITDPHQTMIELDWNGRRRLFDNYKKKATSIEFK